MKTHLIALCVVALSVGADQPTPSRPGYFGFGFNFHRYGTKTWLFVQYVREGGPAARAGLTAQDVVTAIDGKPLRHGDAYDVLQTLSHFPAGRRTTFTVVQKQKQRDIVITPESMNDTQYVAWQRNLSTALESRSKGVKKEMSSTQ